MFELKVNDEIASAHFIRGYPGKCRHLHGHTWKVEVTARAAELDDLGMVADFAEIKAALKDYLGTLDHKNLNELEPFREMNPTTENLARLIYREFGETLKPLKIVKVEVWESARASAVYYE